MQAKQQLMSFCYLWCALAFSLGVADNPIGTRRQQEELLLRRDLQETKQDETAELSDIHYQEELMASYGANTATIDTQKCQSCIKVVGDVMSKVSGGVAELETREKAAKEQYKALKSEADAAHATGAADTTARKEAADHAYTLAKPVDTAARQQLIEDDFDVYCNDPALEENQILKAECSRIQPLKGIVSEPVANGEPVVALDLCRSMSEKNPKMCDNDN